jgi:hypothetical protein
MEVCHDSNCRRIGEGEGAQSDSDREGGGVHE